RRRPGRTAHEKPVGASEAALGALRTGRGGAVRLDELYGREGFDAAVATVVRQLSSGLEKAVAPRAPRQRSLSSVHESLQQVRESQVPMLARSLADLEAVPERAAKKARHVFGHLARRTASQSLGVLATTGRAFAQRNHPQEHGLDDS